MRFSLTLLMLFAAGQALAAQNYSEHWQGSWQDRVNNSKLEIRECLNNSCLISITADSGCSLKDNLGLQSATQAEVSDKKEVADFCRVVLKQRAGYLKLGVFGCRNVCNIPDGLGVVFKR